MSVREVKNYLAQFGAQGRVRELELSSATVELAAQALCVAPARIAKTLSFQVDDRCVLVVAAGDAKIDNAKYRAYFHCKAKMLSAEDVPRRTGHPVGGVCPFALPPHTEVFLDESLKRFDTVFPACGSANSAIELNCNELFRFAKAKAWIDVCKGWQEEKQGD
jgi:prolyl-tRNA editing enzyme YbaK/EbsC (Cys-tRNA(Pro) deacylase)